MIVSCTTLTYPSSIIASPSFSSYLSLMVYRPITHGPAVYISEICFSRVGPCSMPALRQLLISLKEGKGPCQLPTCIIADGILCFAIDVAQEFEIPTLSFRTYSAHCLWTYFHLSKLIEEGEIPFQDENFDKPISCIPGLENVLRRRDLPGICRFENADDPVLQFFVKETSALTRASGLILNTVNEIEAPMITRLGSFFNKIYAIEEIMASANKLARLARDSIKEDGSSFINLEKLIQDIKSMTS
ncbi:hypothetical protein Pint_35286 [Pistacia integerrima]|uniref:Uncharacterized protein n=1 Tax=Pistacia integerrima TaxID=434235 RepID=A0ACC0Y1T9_9ROSI|nr:hypothetical protein Pint_35286 [Pistacia integerrima]